MSSGLDGFTSLFLEIGVIVAVLWVALWLLVRRRGAPGPAFGSRDCQILRQLTVGPRERVIVVRIGAKQLVLGTSSNAVTLICELDEPLPPADSGGGAFGDVIRNAVGRWRAG